jgi:hypothetical protein
VAVALLAVLIPVGLMAGLSYAGWQLDRTLPWAGLPLLAGAAGLAGLSVAAFARGAAERALVLAVLASALVSPAVFGLVQPALPALKVSPRLAAIRDGLACPHPRVASLGYREPSLVFLIGTDLAMLNSGAEAVDFLRAGGCRLVLVEGRFAPDFEAAEAAEAAKTAKTAKASGVAPVVAGQVSGFNINGGRRVDLTAYGVSP